MIKNIIFDIGNVLADFPWQKFYADFGYDEETLEKLGKATVKSPEWNEVDRGVWSYEEVIEAFVKNDPSIEKEIRESLADISNLVTKRDYAIPWIKSLQEAGYRCYYLSNFSEKAHAECREALSFLPYMDGGVFSFQEKVIKPDTAIYQTLLDRYDLKAEECVFMDDTEKNLPPAGALGIRTILFQDREQAVEELERLFLQ